MSRVAKLFRRSQHDGRYNLSREGTVVQVKLLDNTSVDFALGASDTGETVLDKIGKLISLSEMLYFGLKIRTTKGYYRWVDRERPVREQLAKHADRSYSGKLYFAIQYFVHDVALLPEENTRYHYYLQLKKLILSRRLLCGLDQAIILASYALQAEFGDHDCEVHTVDFLSDFDLVPSDILADLDQHLVMQRVAELHRKNRGLSPAKAEEWYIKQAQLLPTYGIEFFPAKDINNLGLLLGASFVGIVVRHANGLPPVSFRWADILNLRPRSKSGGGQLQIETPTEYIFFKMDTADMAHYVWHFFTLQHTFFHKVVGLSSAMSGRSKATRQEFSLDTPNTGDTYANGSSDSRSVPRRLTISRIKHRDEVDGTSPKADLGPGDDNNEVLKETPMDISHLHSPIGPRTTSLKKTNGRDSSASSEFEYAMTKGGKGVASGGSVKHVATGTGHYAVVSKSQRSPGEPKMNGHSMPIASPSSDEQPPPLTQRQNSSTLRSNGSHDDPRGEHRPSPLDVTTPDGVPPDGMTKRFSAAAVTAIGLWNQVLSGSSENLVQQGDTETRSTSTSSSRHEPPALSPNSPRSEQSKMLRDHITEGNIYQEFEDIPRKRDDLSATDARKPENIPRNRFRDISPYDVNRVLLNKDNNPDKSDYINASHVQVDIGGRHRHYIAAQAPVKLTVPDFWQMIWEQEIVIVAMVTPRYEGNREKSAAYWPESIELPREERYGKTFEVRLVDVDQQDKFVTRRLQVTNLSEKKMRSVTHFQFLGWPDHGVPENPRDFLDYLGAVRSLRSSPTSPHARQGSQFEPPVLLHCSAGIGRTGVTILLDILITAFEENQPIDIPGALQNLRDQRAHFVQTAGQYKMVYETLIEYLNSNRLI